MPPTPDDDLLTISEAARLLGVSVDTMRNWERDGKISTATRTDGGHRRFRRGDLRRAA